MLDPTMVEVLIRSTEDVFRTMVSPVMPGTPQQHPFAELGPHVVGAVGFKGRHTGVVGFYASVTAARAIAATLLGIAPEDIGDEVSDAIGEMTNLIAGSFRTSLAQEFGTWDLSPPSVVTGIGLRATHVGTVDRVLCPFHFGDECLYVELALTERVRRSAPAGLRACTRLSAGPQGLDGIDAGGETGGIDAGEQTD